LESIKNKYDIKYKIQKAKNKGLIKFNYRKLLKDMFDWVEIKNNLTTMTVYEVKKKHNISNCNWNRAKNRKLI
jgi:hypothetical protein